MTTTLPGSRRTIPPTSAAPASTFDRAELTATADSFGVFASAYEDQADRDRRLPDLVVEELLRTGLVRLVRPARLGGIEADVTTYVDVLRAVAVHSASAAWVMQVLTAHEWFMAYTHPTLQDEIWGDDLDTIVVDAVMPAGRVEPADGGGYTMSGRWKFVSGVEWCHWAALGGLVALPDGDGPEPCLLFVRRADFEVIDEWDTIGLRGTASNTVVVEDVHVPPHRVFPIARVAATGNPCAQRLDDGPLFHVPWGPMLSASIFPVSVGLAQRAVAQFRAWTEKRIRPFEAGAAQRDNPSARLTLAECAAATDAAYALLLRYGAEMDRYAAQGHSVLAPEERARLFAWRGYIARTCLGVVDRLYNDAGAHAIFPGHPMNRTFRDAHAAASHASLAPGDAMNSYGNTLFGGPGHPMM